MKASAPWTTVFAIILCLASTASHAEDRPDDGQREKVFRKSFEADYESLHCFDNASRLIMRFKEAGIDVSGAKVLILGHRNEFVDVSSDDDQLLLNPLYERPRGNRWRPSENTKWSFHVVVELDDKIYDSSMGLEPSVESRKSYFEKMWLDTKNAKHRNIPEGIFGVEPIEPSDLVVKEIPATDFLRDTFSLTIASKLTGPLESNPPRWYSDYLKYLRELERNRDRPEKLDLEKAAFFNQEIRKVYYPNPQDGMLSIQWYLHDSNGGEWKGVDQYLGEFKINPNEEGNPIGPRLAKRDPNDTLITRSSLPTKGSVSHQESRRR